MFSFKRGKWGGGLKNKKFVKFFMVCKYFLRGFSVKWGKGVWVLILIALICSRVVNGLLYFIEFLNHGRGCV